MNSQHLRAFLWLHWRLRVNQLMRGGIANRIILGILTASVLISAVGVFVAAFGLAFVFIDAPPSSLLFTWDGLVFVFLAWWSVGLLVDLQRSEALSLTKFLHLPVSLFGVFALNYVCSLFSVNLFLFVPAMVGFTLGLSFARGPQMLVLLPVLAAFVLMVSAVSYQFQGWLASLMVDKRRRRTVIVVATMLFILVFQLPNLINIIRPWDRPGPDAVKAIAEHQDRKESWKQIEEISWWANAALPVGWLPLGAMELSQGNPIPAVLGMLGMSAIGGVCLRRAYRTTVKLYTGQFTKGAAPPTASVPHVPVVKADARTQPAGFMAREIPWLSEPASAIALAGFRTLTRAPETKMLLLTPVIIVLIFGGMSFRNAAGLPEAARPVLAFGAISMVLVTLVQFVGNQFGFDRGGFRVFVLSPAPRREILLGKNLAVLPVAVVLLLPLLASVQIVYPLRFDLLLSVAPQFVTMFLLFCMIANLLSIYAPMPVAAGSLKSTQTKWTAVALGMIFIATFPFAMAPALLPYGIEFALEWLEWRGGIPVCLLLSLLEAAGVVQLYRVVLAWEGGLLQGREQRILEAVSAKAE